MLEAETTAMNTTETATASSAIFAWVLRLALIREWLFMGSVPSFDAEGIAQACFRRMLPLFRLYCMI